MTNYKLLSNRMEFSLVTISALNLQWKFLRTKAGIILLCLDTPHQTTLTSIQFFLLYKHSNFYIVFIMKTRPRLQPHRWHFSVTQEMISLNNFSFMVDIRFLRVCHTHCSWWIAVLHSCMEWSSKEVCELFQKRNQIYSYYFWVCGKS